MFFSPLMRFNENKPSDNSDIPSPRPLADLESELQRREQLVDINKLIKKDTDSKKDTIPLPRLVVFIDYIDPSFSHPALQLLLSKGREWAYTVFS